MLSVASLRKSSERLVLKARKSFVPSPAPRHRTGIAPIKRLWTKGLVARLADRLGLANSSVMSPEVLAAAVLARSSW